MSAPLTEYKRSVSFSDTDMAGVVHFTTILRYVEDAEHAALRQMDVPAISKDGGFPKVHVECDYRSPVRFGDEVCVQLELDKISTRSLSWSFVLSVKEKIAARGKIVTAMVSNKGESIEIPKEWRDKLESI